MFRILTSLVLFCAVGFMASSCATMLYGSHATINVATEPNGARVYVNGVDQHVTTPGNITVKRSKKDHYVKFEKPGYEDGVYNISPHFNALVALDLMAYLIPGVVDLAVGAHHIYNGSVFVQLRKNQEQLIPAPPIVLNNKYAFNRMSDVDVDIPELGKEISNRYALIIGNEDYSTYQKELSTESDVLYARDDASAFYDYARKVLGIPERNIIFSLDATSAEMRQGLLKMNLIAKSTDGQAEFFAYYAGHGLPDEETKDPYLIPVDVSGKFIKLGVPLAEFYQSLTEFPTKKTTVFLDACFSGGARNMGLYASRGVRVTPKSDMLKGNVVAFTASSGEESALPHVKKHHGLFTYYLLQKLKETKGDLTYKDLSLFMEQHVSLESIIVNSKEQHPKTNVSADVVDVWEAWTLK